MGHILKVDVPEEAYEPLARTAKLQGSTPEKLASEWLVTAIRQTADDPIEQFIGAFNSNISDWTEQHDKYLGQALADTMSDQEETAS